MKKLTYLAYITLLLTTLSCNKKNYSPMNYEKMQVVFGNMGGFAGTTTEYTLLENGQLFKRYGQILKDDYSTLPSIGKKDMKSILKVLKAAELTNISLNKPANFSYFIEIIDKKKNIQHKVIWGNEADASTPQNVKDVYNLLHTWARGKEEEKENLPAPTEDK
ncbi:MAG: hypothetical protein KA974_06040 [Saprospiraceae bacterium]|nr:hypothetical protein [Saprospiraceae bacterium]MBP7699560.1 hypothetical protein [Saprospiraceae bacterium]